MNAFARKFMILMALSSVAVAVPAGWEEVEAEEAVCPDYLTQLNGHAELIRVLQNNNHRTLEQLWGSEPMQTFLRKRAPELQEASVWDHAEIVASYLDSTIHVRSKKITAERKSSLAAAFQNRGHRDRPTLSSPRKRFETQSLENLRRLVGPNLEADEGPIAEATPVLARFHPVFTHIAPRKVQVPETQLLSSHQLEILGFSGGLNTAAFNRWLNADDQVFFFVHIERTNGENEKTRAYSRRNMSLSFGSAEAILENQYAADNGWISAYIMDPDDLIEFGDIRDPETTQRLRKNLAHHFGIEANIARPVETALESDGTSLNRAWETLTRYPALAGDFAKLRSQLGALDLTVPDFTTLVRRQLRHSLRTTFQRDGADAFRQELQLLSEGNARQLADALQRHFYEPLKLPRDFELKVPVLVAPRVLTPGQ